MLIAGRSGPERQVDLLKHPFGLTVVACMGANGRFDDVGGQRAGHSLFGRLANRHGQQSAGQAEPIVKRPANSLGLRRPAGHVPTVQQRRNRRQFVPLKPFGGGQLFLDRHPFGAGSQQHLAFQVRRKPARNDLEHVRLAVVEIAFLVAIDPKRAEQHRRTRDGARIRRRENFPASSTRESCVRRSTPRRGRAMLRDRPSRLRAAWPEP